MEAMKTSKDIRKGAPQAPVLNGKASLSFGQLRAIRTMLISHKQALEVAGNHPSAAVVQYRINELSIAIREAS